MTSKRHAQLHVYFAETFPEETLTGVKSGIELTSKLALVEASQEQCTNQRTCSSAKQRKLKFWHRQITHQEEPRPLWGGYLSFHLRIGSISGLGDGP
jgi:hypothetical protein